MREISLTQELSSKLNRCRCVSIKGSIDLTDSPSLSPFYEKELSQLNITHSRNHVIDECRDAYRICGKKPGRYRPSAEALRRRFLSGKGIQQISPVVDIINLTSLKTGYSIGGYDHSYITGECVLTIGGKEEYNAIGKGHMNIEFLPVLRDEIGPFGSPTSDSIRTMIKEDSENILIVFYDFYSNDAVHKSYEYAYELLVKYCNFQ